MLYLGPFLHRNKLLGTIFPGNSETSFLLEICLLGALIQETARFLTSAIRLPKIASKFTGDDQIIRVSNCLIQMTPCLRGAYLIRLIICYPIILGLHYSIFFGHRQATRNAIDFS